MGIREGVRKSAFRIALVASVLAVIGFAAVAMHRPGQALALDGEEQAFLTLINNYRAANGAGVLTANATLTAPARWMAQDLADHNYFSHTDSLGRNPFQRMDDFGYSYNTWRGENLAAGVEGAQAAFQLWKDSPGHNENMLNPNFTVIGIARGFNAGSDFKWYWATSFGGFDDSAPPPPPAPAPDPPPALAPDPAPAPALAPAPDPQPAPEVHIDATPAPSPTTLVQVQVGEIQTGTVHNWWRSLSMAPFHTGPAASEDGGGFLGHIASMARAFLSARPGYVTAFGH